MVLAFLKVVLAVTVMAALTAFRTPHEDSVMTFPSDWGVRITEFPKGLRRLKHAFHNNPALQSFSVTLLTLYITLLVLLCYFNSQYVEKLAIALGIVTGFMVALQFVWDFWRSLKGADAKATSST
jgi:hypothetical protein